MFCSKYHQKDVLFLQMLSSKKLLTLQTKFRVKEEVNILGKGGILKPDRVVIGKRYNHTIANLEAVDGRADLVHDAHGLMTGAVGVSLGPVEPAIVVQVGTAYRRRGDAHNGVLGLYEFREGHVAHRHFPRGVVEHCADRLGGLLRDRLV